MRIFGVPLKERIKRIDPILFGAPLFLSVISILTIFGAVDNFGRSKLVMQIAMTVTGILVMAVLSNLDYRFFTDRFYLPLFIGSALLLAVTLVFGSSEGSANTSWLNIPFVNIAIQPSEFVKIAFLCTFSHHIERVRDRLNRPLTLLGLLLHAGVILGLILLSGDLGVALVYIGIVAVMLFCAGLSVWYFVGALGAVTASFPLWWRLLNPYQQNRIIYGFRPELDAEHWGQQALLSRETIANGGLLGQGLTTGGYYEDLAASHTDFIFATVCEKFGFVGGFLVVAALALLTIRLLYLAFRCTDMVGRLICSGIAAIILLQTLENLWMCLALVPVVGITLPFVSCGGSSVLALYILIGFAHSVAAREKRFYFRRASLSD